MKRDTTTATNAGFGIAAALTSICFSWLKTLNADVDSSTIDRIRKIGEVSLFIGLMFLVASALKYGYFALEQEKYKNDTFYALFKVGALLSSTFLFSISFFLFGKIIKNIMSLIYDRNHSSSGFQI